MPPALSAIDNAGSNFSVLSAKAGEGHLLYSTDVVAHSTKQDVGQEIKKILAKDIVQRTIYGLGLLLWTWIFWDTLSGELGYSTSSLGINYMTLYLMPASILGLQILRNNRILWSVILGLITTYIIVSLYMLISDAIERSGNHVKAIDWGLKDIGIVFVFFTVFGLVDWLIFLMRPKRLI